MDWDKFHELSKWHDMDMYQCKVCSYSTVGGVSDILAHVAGHFPARLRRDQAGTETDDDLLVTAGSVEWVTHSTIDAADEEE